MSASLLTAAQSLRDQAANLRDLARFRMKKACGSNFLDPVPLLRRVLAVNLQSSFPSADELRADLVREGRLDAAALASSWVESRTRAFDRAWAALDAGENAGRIRDDLARSLNGLADEIETVAKLCAESPIETRSPEIATQVRYVLKADSLKLNPENDPILCVREWVEGYAFTLSEADRARHYPGATEADHRKMLDWADDPERDRNYEAIGLLLERIRRHLHPPYSPEVLLNEHRELFRIPVRDRLAERFPDRMHSWLDRVETYLSIGAGASPEEAGIKMESNRIDGNAPAAPITDGEYRHAAWFERATRSGLGSDILRNAKHRGMLKKSKKVSHRWSHCVAEVCELYPHHATAIRNALDRAET